MKNLLLMVCVLFAVACKENTSTAGKENHRVEDHEHKTTNTQEQTKVLSPHTQAMATIGEAHIHIDYSSPRVRDRIVFGGLVGYDAVWQAGAHKATWIETDTDLKIEGKTLPAGRYGLFMIPRKEQPWTVIFNERWDQHGKDEYNEAEDVLRTAVTARELEESQESLVYEVRKSGNDGGKIVFLWANKEIELPFEVK